MSGRGKALELGLSHAAAAYLKAGLAAIVRQYPRTAAGPDGTMRYAGEAPVDFLGARAGGHALALEAKETDRAEGFKLDEDHLSRAQINACRALVWLDVEVHLIIDYKRVGEVYAVPWAAVDAFLAAPWRASLSLDWARAYGLLLPERYRDDEKLRRTFFLDGAAHPDNAECLLRVQTERQSRPVITLDEKLAADAARDHKRSKAQLALHERLASRPAPGSPEYREYMQRLVAEGCERQRGATKGRSRFRGRGGHR